MFDPANMVGAVDAAEDRTDTFTTCGWLMGCELHLCILRDLGNQGFLGGEIITHPW